MFVCLFMFDLIFYFFIFEIFIGAQFVDRQLKPDTRDLKRLNVKKTNKHE